MTSAGSGGGYGAGRDSQEQLSLQSQIDTFVSHYASGNPSQPRKIIILFPGGMGSQLMRANQPAQGGPNFTYYRAWLGCNIAFGEATKLQILQNDEDYEQHYVVPEGAVDLVVLHPYEGFINWCKVNGIYLFIFGWDWRRSINETVGFFLNKFLPALDSALKAGANTPLQNYTLLGHSEGGMVVKMIANQSTNAYVQAMQSAITVAAPFYGYCGNLPRFFNGDPDLNWTEGPIGASAITRIVSSMPGAYELLCMDQATYEANKTALNHDPEGYNLAAYPTTDAINPGEVADPYNPIPSGVDTPPGALVRYIPSCGFDWDLLSAGKNTVAQIPQPLTAAIASKFYCIRGVRVVKGVEMNDTIVSQTWRRVPQSFNPDTSATPLADTMGPGDGTQPAWTARLLGLPAGHVITVRGDIEHMFLMNESSVQQQIGTLIGAGTQMIVVPTPALTIASRPDLEEFLAPLRAIALNRSFSDDDRRRRIQAYLQGFTERQRQEYLGRAFIDALKGPSQKTARRPEAEK